MAHLHPHADVARRGGLIVTSALRVLIVEDDVFIAMSIGMMVEDLGHEVVGPAVSVAAAMRLIEQQAIDVALLDVNLGGGATSEPIAKDLARADVPYAFVTAYARDAVPYASEADLIVAKPPSARGLEAALNQIVAC